MNLHDLFESTVDIATSIFAALGPAAAGSAVAQAWKPGLNWRARLVQWIVGICVSWFVTRGLTIWLGWHDFVAQAVGFVIGMIAFEVAPKFVKAMGDIAAELPETVKAFLLKWKGPKA